MWPGGERMMLRRSKESSNIFELFEFTYDVVSDEVGTKESKRIDTLIFKGSIVECYAYIQLLKDGWFVKLK